VGRCDVETELFDEPGQAGCLALGQVEDEPRQGGGIEDRVLERALQAPADQPRVERVVAVLHQDRALGETEKAAARVLELGRADQHRAVDVMALAGVGIDRRSAVDKGVEERKRGPQREAFGADLEDQEGRVACGLDVEGDELRVVEQGLRADLRGVDRDLLPHHRGGGATGLEVERFRLHQRASARARRAHAISSPLSARSSRTATT